MKFMKIINGVYTSAKIFTDQVEAYALAQIQMLCDHEAFQNSKIRVMPDVHPGKVGTIGFTATVGDRILPGVVGIDIGCGITLARIRQRKAEFQRLDNVIRDRVPSGSSVRQKPHRFAASFDLTELACEYAVNRKKAACSIGTLGGGNHFIEVDEDEEGCLYVAIHSGSRHLGKEVTEYYLREGQEYWKQRGIQVPYEMVYLEQELLQEYLYDVSIVQKFAALNREAILDELVRGMKWKVEEVISSAHNYVARSGPERLLRKGAVSAQAGEAVVIPVNMRDGILLCEGKGNEDWNCSAPHGAGRVLKRQDVKETYTVSKFKQEMKGIYCSCIGSSTLDEAPFAYRRLEEIQAAIGDTVTIKKRLRPVYCYKDSKEKARESIVRREGGRKR